MIWLTWRQHRFETLMAGAVMALLSTFLIKTGTDMASVFQHTGLSACLSHAPSPSSCLQLSTAFNTRFSAVTVIVPWLNFVPLVLGILLAAPVVLDLEHGTYRLAWTQSVTRGRWLAVKLTLIMAGAVAGALLLVALMTWWNGPLDQISSRLNRDQFDFEGIVPVAYTLFAAALCLAAGSLLRRVLPAVGVTAVGYLVARIGLQSVVGSGYLAPVTKHMPFTAAALGPGPHSRADLFIRSDASIPKAVQHACLGGALRPPPPGSAGAAAVQACFGRHGVFATVVYQPASRFWLFQGIESAIFLVPTLVLLAVTVWAIRFRVA
jgi:hypothetical protein